MRESESTDIRHKECQRVMPGNFLLRLPPGKSFQGFLRPEGFSLGNCKGLQAPEVVWGQHSDE